MSSGAPEWARAAALAELRGFGPRTLLAGMRAAGSANALWDDVLAGKGDPEPAMAALLATRAAGVDLDAVAARYVAQDVAVTSLGDRRYPEHLAADHDPPAILFVRGGVEALSPGGPAVAIIGTRRCTRYGRDVACQFGRDLAAAGVTVVSGLALGIDGAAHEGALAAEGAPPVAVVGSGLDVVYPPAHRGLWRRVAGAGALVSEAPLGAAPEAWRFPLRNRIIAALAHVVVVVESHRKGGSNHTVEAAVTRSRPVMAVPGAIRSLASEGTNRLLAEGCAPATDVEDILAALDLEATGIGRPVAVPDRRPPPDGDAAAVLTALGWEAASIDRLVVATGLAPPRVAVALTRLERDGWAASNQGWWAQVAP